MLCGMHSSSKCVLCKSCILRLNNISCSATEKSDNIDQVTGERSLNKLKNDLEEIESCGGNDFVHHNYRTVKDL